MNDPLYWFAIDILRVASAVIACVMLVAAALAILGVCARLIRWGLEQILCVASLIEVAKHAHSKELPIFRTWRKMDKEQ